MIGKFGLLSFLDLVVPTWPGDPAWEQTDYAIKRWFYTLIDDSVLALAKDDPDQTACALYAAISNLFNDNKEAHAVYLSNEFHTPVQGDSSVANYYYHIKTLVDSLRDIGHAVFETQLVLNLIYGLNSKFSTTADHIAHIISFPTFSKARSMLTLKESMLTNEPKVTSETALAATTSPPPYPPGGCTRKPGVHDGGCGGGDGHHGHGGRNNRGHGRNGRGGRGGNNITSTRTPSTPQGPWSCFSPYTQVTPTWRGAPSNCASLLGPAPSAYQSAHVNSFTSLQMPSAPPSAAA
jgi:hypothetical protein